MPDSHCPMYCENHPHTVERVAAMEKGLEGVEETIKTLNTTLSSLRSDITNGIMQRYPATILWVIALLTGFCTSLLTAIISVYFKFK